MTHYADFMISRENFYRLEDWLDGDGRPHRLQKWIERPEGLDRSIAYCELAADDADLIDEVLIIWRPDITSRPFPDTFPLAGTRDVIPVSIIDFDAPPEAHEAIADAVEEYGEPALLDVLDRLPLLSATDAIDRIRRGTNRYRLTAANENLFIFLRAAFDLSSVTVVREAA